MSTTKMHDDVLEETNERIRGNLERLLILQEDETGAQSVIILTEVCVNEIEYLKRVKRVLEE